MARPQTVRRPSSDESMCSAVVSAIAEVKGVDPTDLDERLYDYIDPGALDRLFRSDDPATAPEVQVTFSMAGCRVVIHGRRKVVVKAHSGPVTAREEAV